MEGLEDVTHLALVEAVEARDDGIKLRDQLIAAIRRPNVHADFLSPGSEPVIHSRKAPADLFNAPPSRIVD
jgi:hypothetical protein